MEQKVDPKEFFLKFSFYELALSRDIQIFETDFNVWNLLSFNQTG